MKNNKKLILSPSRLFAFLIFMSVQTIYASEEVLQCPEMGSNEAALGLYMKTELKGGRLSSEYMKNIASCFETDSSMAADWVKIVDSYSLKDCNAKKPDDCFEVTFKILGEVYSGGELKLHKSIVSETVKLSIKLDKKIWKVHGLKSLPPHVSKEGMLDFIENEASGEKSAWKEKLAQALKTKIK
jgi:hypothetical protein